MEYESRERTIRREAFLEIPMVEAMLRCFAALVHGENFPFDGGDIALMFLHDLRLKRGLAVTRNLYGVFAEGRS